VYDGGTVQRRPLTGGTSSLTFGQPGCLLEMEYQQSVPTNRCKTWHPATCDVANETAEQKRVVSPIRLSRRELARWWDNLPRAKGQKSGADIIGEATCTSAQAPQLTPQERFDLLYTSIRDPAGTVPGEPSYPDYARRLKTVYELHAGQLSVPDEAHDFVRSLYDGQLGASSAPSCGENDAAAYDCTAVIAGHESERLDGRLALCKRLSSAHVSGDLVERYYLRDCMGLLAQVDDSGLCPRAVEPETLLKTHDILLTKLLDQLGSSTAGVAIRDLRRSLLTISRWFEDARPALTNQDASTKLARHLLSFWRNAQRARGVYTEALAIEPTLRPPESATQEQQDEARSGLDAAKRAVRSAVGSEDQKQQALARDVLAAAYRASDEKGPFGAPLALVTGDALSLLVDRMEKLSVFHDFACLWAECGADVSTELSRLWSLVSDLDAGQAAEATPSPATTEVSIGGWRDALLDVKSYPEGLRSVIDGAKPIPGVTEEVSRLLELARQRTHSYQSTGFFFASEGNRLYTRVHASHRDRAVEVVRHRADALRSRSDKFHDDIDRIVDRLVSASAAETSAIAVATRRDAAAARFDQKQRQLTAHAAAFDAIDDFEKQLAAEFSQAQSALAGQYLNLAPPPGYEQPIQFSAASAAWLGGSELAQLSSAPKIEAQAHELITVSVPQEDRWSPTCALRSRDLVGPQSNTPMEIDLSAATTGPEGFTIISTQNRYKATSTSDTKADASAYGFRAEACAGFGIGQKKIFSVQAQACTFVNKTWSTTHADTDTAGSHSQVNASFSSGIFLQNTPIPAAPAGSIVLVELPPNATNLSEARNVHLVRSPNTTISLSEPADLYLVANDHGSCQVEADRSNVLHVSVRKLLGANEAGRQFVVALTKAAELIRSRAARFIERGEMLPFEVTALEAAARRVVLSPPDGLRSITELPEVLRALFDQFVAQELARVQRMVLMSNLEREISLARAELQALDVNAYNSEEERQLLALLPKWAVGNSDVEALHREALALMELVRQYFVPVVRLWFPDVAVDLEGLPAVSKLRNIGIDTPMSDVVTWTENVVRHGLDRFAAEVLEERVDKPWVAVRLRNPDRPCEPWAGCGLADFPEVSDERSQQFWAALKEGRPFELLIKPSDLYRRLGAAYLSCRHELPVVRRIGLIFTGTGDSTAGWSDLRRALDASFDSTQEFVSAAGPEYFLLLDQAQREFSLPVRFATEQEVIEVAASTIEQDPLGLSPFGRFRGHFDSSARDQWHVTAADSAILVFELETLPLGADAPVRGCTPGE
jgi:hypothetical protein